MRLILSLLFSLSLVACGFSSKQQVTVSDNTSRLTLEPDTVASEPSVGDGLNIPQSPPNEIEDCGNELSCGMYEKINSIRAANGRFALDVDRACQQMAQAHAEDMAVNDYFSHTNLNGEGPSDRVIRYGGRFAAENIAFGPDDIDRVADLWMSSSGHRANILDRNYSKTGLGAAFTRQGTYWVQCFTQ